MEIKIQERGTGKTFDLIKEMKSVKDSSSGSSRATE